MSDEAKEPEAGGKPWRYDDEPLPWSKFYWREWLSDPAIRRLSLEQRARFMDVRCATLGTKTPGVMDEEDVRAWAGYSPKEWAEVRELFSRLFNLKRKRRKWVLAEVLDEWQAAMEMARTNYVRAMKGVNARANRRKDLATTSTTSGATHGSPQVELDVHTDVRSQTSDSRDQQPDKPKGSEVSATPQTALSRVGSAGSAGPPSLETLGGILARAGVSNGNGGSGRKGA